MPHARTLPKAFALLGPTACGKTALALALAERLPVEIISLDSALVYREMDIGTAKPSPAELAAVPHHLIDIIDPPQSYSAAQFVADCTRLTAEITARGRLPLIVGGTMMYYHALTAGLNSLPEADAATRAALRAQKAAEGTAALYRRLLAVDPATAARLAPGDSQRIERALEVYLVSGRPLSAHFAAQKTAAPALRLCTLALIPENRRLLHAQIEKRFTDMLENGFPEEVGRLKTRYPELNADSPAVRCVGYRQAWAYLAGETDYAQLAAQGTAATRQLAKRQLTWLRKLNADITADPFAQTPAALIQTASEAVRRHFSP
ncbi:tRNA (adenosine(37)-N6)-dimethylallyltransferase MiaA [Neisseria leonii]|uniref:tRNA dimethylallyltransferase n=1 Tax=Neisseria leonii TaxID=2995413 RepID=A0A9X4E455_9NEIS|nr:tRNA (adenosine(37)-N6)-dimethylallyltransferase MiaA [Neisseria sp. 51.81]MDD9328399.1 tRNA (adenosine(37)-N6)-dimethylallyltransferase MiaA [Neisseria sp. 51.81]